MLKVKIETLEQNRTKITYCEASLINITDESLKICAFPLGFDNPSMNYHFWRNTSEDHIYYCDTTSTLNNLWIDGELIDLGYGKDKI